MLTTDHHLPDTMSAEPETWAYMARNANRSTITEIIYVSVPFGRTTRIVQKRVIRTKRFSEIQHERKLADWQRAVNRINHDITRMVRAERAWQQLAQSALDDWEFNHAAEMRDMAREDLAAAKAFRQTLLDAKPTQPS